MGVIFNDPDLELEDIYWYMVLEEEMGSSLRRREGLITVDKELNTKSCYVELHRKGKSVSSKTIFFSLLMLFLPAKVTPLASMVKIISQQ